ncbi:MAG: phytoene/squalene synthase family protein [Crocinitomicaceae bacterium]|jgi:phytoene synthase|nr:phytoene/squalene synthase family protein [Crocinitomicaceae bacterium]MCF8434730.1 phytoene/squalene synthase family protein [Crocinitomicaceae bacterium]MDP4683478.1 phytoene/squalene synthase family protein [Crocinitomicaceae bacterium]MDP4866401.1 phytoene/squalene synthase family protein [Crocinitomicaceae bacterium]MDP5010015.1 phytoene/squalene synthase family protein [Crocinitomicaceae bacterium]
MKQLFDDISHEMSELTTKRYSTSFSLGISFLHKSLHKPIYAIYGFVRFADEIVDSFHNFPKADLLEDFKRQTYLAIEQGVSLNPILNSFQWAVNKYSIPLDLIETFLQSMEMDLDKTNYDPAKYEQYILGSAEVVGLMCLKIFVKGNDEEYERLKPAAMKLGSAFQKINFLRDLKADYHELGRTYFPGIDLNEFNSTVKNEIEADIEKDFKAGYEGIKQLPKNSRFGVYMAYVYYYKLFSKIKTTSANTILNERIRIPNNKKYRLFVTSYVRHNLNLI